MSESTDACPRFPSFRVLPLALVLAAVLSGQAFHGSVLSQRLQPNLNRPAACSGTSWIGILSHRRETQPKIDQTRGQRQKRALRCPRGWQWVFSSNSRQPPPPGLQRFCRYVGRATHPGSGPEASRRSGLFESIERDCRIVGPAGETIFPTREMYRPLKGRFLREARGDVAPRPRRGSDRVRLVIVDSFQDDARPQDKECPASLKEGQLECSPHGEVLARLASDLLCAGSDCRAEVTTRRALAWTHEIRPASKPPKPVELKSKDAPGKTQGGSSGTTLNLAMAIFREVDAWLREPSRPRLILNLSLGWEEVNDPSGNLGKLARAAVEYAVCNQALVIAAAGNRVSGPPKLMERPLLPAAWEQEPALTAGDCAAFLGKSEPASSGPEPSYRPLVYAVGGVQHDGLPLSNSRPKASPRLVAYGDHAPAFYPGSPPRMKILTGTSVSALVASAAAAARWYRKPDLTPFEVMAELWKGGHKSALPIDFCLDPDRNCPSDGRARRVFVHPTDKQARPAWPGGKPEVDASRLAALGRTIEVPGKPTIDLPQCFPSGLLSMDSPIAQAELCPQLLPDIRSQPWTGPQPGANHNPACSYRQSSPGTLILEFDPCFRVEGRPVRLDDFTLIAKGKAIRLPISGFELGDAAESCPRADDPRRVQVVLTDFKFEGRPHPMYLAVTVNGKHATLTPLLQVFGED